MNMMQSLEELDRKICEAMGVCIEKYNAMSISDQYKLRQKHLKQNFGLKARKTK
jgi:hypothetical protein